MKKILIGAAVAMAFGATSVAHAAATIGFDINGAAAGGAISVDSFDWAPGNALVMGAYSTAPDQNGLVSTQVVAQATLGSFVQNTAPKTFTSPLAGTEFTFQARFFENVIGLGSGQAAFTPGAGVSSVSIYYDTSADANSATGAGFGDGVEILRANMVGLTGTFLDFTILAPLLFPAGLLDQVNADGANGTLSHTGNGSTTIQFDVTYADPAFFLSSVTSLSVDMQDTTNNVLPFGQEDPSDKIFNETPFYTVVGGQRINGAGATDCARYGSQDENGNAGTRCDLQLQTDAVTSFNPVPEPGSLALLGLGLSAFGLARRRKAV